MKRRLIALMLVVSLVASLCTTAFAAGTDVTALAGALNTFLEGLSIQARDGILQVELKAMASHALRLLPSSETR